MTLVDFLLARIAEDEAVAKSVALDPRNVDRRQFGKAGRMQWLALIIDRPWRAGISRALAECEAKRRIVVEHDRGHCECRSVRALATIYAGHPDYREEWRP